MVKIHFGKTRLLTSSAGNSAQTHCQGKYVDSGDALAAHGFLQGSLQFELRVDDDG
jgi:hypothetical protein